MNTSQFSSSLVNLCSSAVLFRSRKFNVVANFRVSYSQLQVLTSVERKLWVGNWQLWISELRGMQQ